MAILSSCRCSQCNCEREKGCTCWWGAYAKIGGGTGFDIAKYDPKCPEHGEEVEASQYGNT